MKYTFPIFAILTILSSFSCGQIPKDKKVGKATSPSLELKATSEAFNDYWYNGLAELNSFDLEQARYGEIHQGEIVMVFVTEDFLLNKQVKKERQGDEEVVSVLKMNLDREFTTGIYDYSMMSSVFTPITEHKWQQPIKVSTSSQEWCGHSWTQLNQSSEGYDFEQYSYFQAEGDQEMKLDQLLLEDGIWNQIRLNPERIDSGKQQMFPSTQYIRFSHIDPKAYEVIISKEAYQGDDMPGQDLKLISLNYPELNRQVDFIYEAEYPHQIAGFKDHRLQSGLVTVAKRKASIRLDYWNKNDVDDRIFRDSLKLE